MCFELIRMNCLQLQTCHAKLPEVFLILSAYYISDLLILGISLPIGTPEIYIFVILLIHSLTEHLLATFIVHREILGQGIEQ